MQQRFRNDDQPDRRTGLLQPIVARQMVEIRDADGLVRDVVITEMLACRHLLTFYPTARCWNGESAYEVRQRRRCLTCLV
jgi:hypothetical protein